MTSTSLQAQVPVYALPVLPYFPLSVAFSPVPAQGCPDRMVPNELALGAYLCTGDTRRPDFMSAPDRSVIDGHARVTPGKEELTTLAEKIRQNLVDNNGRGDAKESAAAQDRARLVLASRASDALAGWSRNNDIGSEVLKLFFAALIGMRESMRESRQLALTEYSRHADNAVAELRKQGDDNWRKEITNAVGSIVSGVVQIGVVLSMTGPASSKEKADSESHIEKKPAPASPTENVPPATNRRGSASNAHPTLADTDLRSGPNNTQILKSTIKKPKNQPSDGKTSPEVAQQRNKNASTKDAETDAVVTDGKSATATTTADNASAQTVHSSLAYSRAAGDITTGLFGIGGAYYGLDAAYHGAEHFRENAEMQKELFQRDKWSTESDVLSRTMEQVLASINDMQTRQSDSIGKLIGRV